MFSKRLRELRTEKNMDQKSLAEDLGIPVMVMMLYESGLRKPTLECIKKIAKYFEVSTDYLIGLKCCRNCKVMHSEAIVLQHKKERGLDHQLNYVDGWPTEDRILLKAFINKILIKEK